MAQAGIGRSSCFPRQDPLSVDMHAPTNLLHTFCLSVTTIVTEMNPLTYAMCNGRLFMYDFSAVQGLGFWGSRIPSQRINEAVRLNRVEMVDRRTAIDRT